MLVNLSDVLQIWLMIIALWLVYEDHLIKKDVENIKRYLQAVSDNIVKGVVAANLTNVGLPEQKVSAEA